MWLGKYVLSNEKMFRPLFMDHHRTITKRVISKSFLIQYLALYLLDCGRWRP